MKLKAKQAKQNKILEFVRKKLLLFVIFITGACVLVLEIVATRMLSPYFGNTIFTVTSVIGVVLAALSFGYYFGGIVADKNPTEKLFFKLILLSGFLVLLLQILYLFLIPAIAYDFTSTSGPLMISLILFLLPSFVLGMLSPFSIKLQEQRFEKVGIGKLSGEVFFASTLGSIFGTFLAGYFLIPNFGIQNIVVAVGTVLVLIGFLGNFSSNTKKGIFPIFLFFCLLLGLSSVKQTPLPGEIFAKDGVYEKIKVIETEINQKAVRVLLQDASFSSAAYIHESPDLVFGYTNYYKVHRLVNPNPKKALFIGGGAYSVPSRLVQEIPDVQVDVAEIEPELFTIAQKYFNADQGGRIKNHIVDGRRFLKDSQDTYDLIFSDVYFSIYSIPSHFTTIEFFRLTRDHLSDNGIFMANLIGDLSRQENSFMLSELKTLREVFPKSYLFAVESTARSLGQNFIFVGLKQDFDLLGASEKSSDDLIRNLNKKLIKTERFNLTNYSILTDNYAPIDIYTASLLKREQIGKQNFSGSEALASIEHQVSFEQRNSGSEGNKQVGEMIAAEMSAINGNVVVQTFEKDFKSGKQTFSNIVSQIDPDAKKRIILATHYDTKKFADLDKKGSQGYVPGANDGASGTAVLMELAKIIANSQFKPKVGIDLVFFDGEEGVEGEDWYPVGSTYFAENLKSLYTTEKPTEGVVLDLICDKDLDIYKEQNSVSLAPNVTNKIFDLATSLYPGNFHNEVKFSISDDHIPLNKAGIPTTLLIDFEYLFFHTTKDTPDKCSGESLKKVGDLLLKYIYSL